MKDNTTHDNIIDAKFKTKNVFLDQLLQKCNLKKKITLEEAEPIIFLFFLISETFGRSCLVYLTQMGIYLDNPITISRLSYFQPTRENDEKKKRHAPRYLLNFIVLRNLLREKNILSAKGEKKIEGMRDDRKTLTRYISDSLEAENFLRGYVVIRYIAFSDEKLLEVLKSVLLKTVNDHGNFIFTERDVAPYFDQQKKTDGSKTKSDIADLMRERDLRAELVSTQGIALINSCCAIFEGAFKAALYKLK